MPVIDELLEANKRFAESFDKGDVPMPPARKAAIVTCMDARLHPATFLGLEIGDAHVIRNAGGRAGVRRCHPLPDHLQPLLGTREFAVIHHTDCGMLTFTNDDLRSKLVDAGDAGGIDFLPFSDNEASVCQDVEKIKSSPFLPEDVTVSGYIYEVETGKLQTVVAPE